MGDKQFGIDNNRLNEYAKDIKEVVDAGVQVAIVIGGGNIFRGIQNYKSAVTKPEFTVK